MKQLTANEIVRRVALSVGLIPTADAFSSDDPVYTQLIALLNDSGDELVELHPWKVLEKETSFTTDGSNPYAYASDFAYMIPGTHWDRTNDLPVGGPLSSQDWQYLSGRDLASSTIYASFREREDGLYIWPETNTGITIFYEYISKNWMENAAGTDGEEVTTTSDVVKYDGSLIRNYLKAKFYEAKGFDTIKPDAVASTFFHGRMAKDKGAAILSVGGPSREYPYIDLWRNVPDTNYGS